MKKIISLSLALGFTWAASAQVSEFKRQIDSLSKLYNKNVIGYSKTITIRKEFGPRESLIIFYEELGETEQFLAWTKKIDETEHIVHLDSLPKIKTNLELSVFDYSVYYDNTYIGKINTRGYFKKCNRELAKSYMKNSTMKFLDNDEALGKWLSLKFGKYYKGIL